MPSHKWEGYNWLLMEYLWEGYNWLLMEYLWESYNWLQCFHEASLLLDDLAYLHLWLQGQGAGLSENRGGRMLGWWLI